MEDNIKELYSQVNDKTSFIKSLSWLTKVEATTIEAYWFADRGYQVPLFYQEETVNLLQAVIRLQNQKVL